MAKVKGVDTTFIIQLEIAALKEHRAATELFKKVLSEETVLAIAPQVLMEFIHIVTDAKRFEVPLTMTAAVERAQLWWDGSEVQQVVPGADVPALTYKWLQKFSLGRNRILDTQLAATYFEAGIFDIISSNHRDFKIFGCFQVEVP